MNTKSFESWIVLHREQGSTEWIAHCLDFDVVTIGRSYRHALEMISEAVNMTIADDLNRGADPYKRKAPGEEWEILWKVLENGEKISPHETQPEDADKSVFIAIQTRFQLGSLDVCAPCGLHQWSSPGSSL